MTRASMQRWLVHSGRGARSVPTGRVQKSNMQQCMDVFTITREKCRACNGLDGECPEYRPNPDPRAFRREPDESCVGLPERLKLCTAGDMLCQEQRYRPLEGGSKRKGRDAGR